MMQNVQSINNKIPLLESFLQDQTYEVICLAETWISAGREHYIQVNGYQFAADFSRRKRKGGGVAILVRDGIEFTTRPDISDLSIEYIIECCAIELKPNLMIICIYRGDREIELFFTFLNQLLKKLDKISNNKHIIIGGDFNLNALDNSSKDYKMLVDTMLECNLRQIVHKPTRETPTTSTCIDLIFTNNKNYTLNILDEGISDHKCVLYTFNSYLSRHPKTTIVHRRNFYNNLDINSFKSELCAIDWNNIIQSNNGINKNYNLFHNKLQQLLDVHFPKKIRKITSNKKKPWLTKGLKTSCKHKRILKIMVNHTRNKILKKYYQLYSKTLKKAIKNCKRNIYSREMKTSTNRTKTMWNIIKRTTKKPTNSPVKRAKTTSGRNTTQCPLSTANMFNSYFASVGSTSQPLHHNSTKGRANGQPVTNPSINTMFLEPVTELEIYKIIRTLPNKYSSGVDEIPTALVKSCINELTIPLTKLINQSFTESIFPDILKIAKIKPILKKGGKSDDPSQYRPIALLPTISKIFEKTMANRICSFTEKYNILHNNQYGFRKNRSTTLAVFKYTQEILNYINDKNYAIGILLDMSKAYDKVNHSILLMKLLGIGIRGNAHQWLKSYLTDRKQLVQMDHLNKDTGELESVTSETLITNWSIPQGSVLGCVLFLIYINDLPLISNPLCVMFADDVSILFKYSHDNNSAYSEIINTFNAVKDWLQDHNLEINNNKTKLIQFKPRQKQQLNLNPVKSSLNIEEVNSFKLLGITLDTHLHWKDHIDNVKSKLSQFIYAIKILKSNTKLECALTAYYAYAYAWFRYGIIMWGHSTDASDLFIIQKKMLRIILNLKQRVSCRPFFTNLNLLTLPSIYILETAMFVKKHISLFEKVKSDRRKNNLSVPTHNLIMYRNSPYYRAVLIYNKLPDLFKANVEHKTFKNKLNSLLITKGYYSIEEFLTDKKI